MKTVQRKLYEFVDKDIAEYWKDLHKLGIHDGDALLDFLVR